MNPITSTHKIVTENVLEAGRLIEAGSLELPKDQIPVGWDAQYEQEPIGFAHSFERRGDEIWCTIDWNEKSSYRFFDSEGKWIDDMFDLSAYATEVKLKFDDDGNYVVKSGVIRAVNVIPFQVFRRE